MRRPRVRALVSLGLLACLMLSLLPLGCSSAKIYRPSVPDDRPRVPEGTAERLRECVDELSGTIAPGYYSLDAAVKVDPDGHVVEVETTGQPNPDVGMCVRIALRGMRLPEDVFARDILRTSASGSGQAMPDRGQVGEVVTIVVVTVVFTEVIIEAFALTIAVAVTATATAGAAEAFARRRRKGPTCLDRYVECISNTRGRELGNHWNETRCATCRARCDKDNEWPRELNPEQSCIYPGFRW